MNAIRHYFIRRALIQASEAHRAGYHWALSQLRMNVDKQTVQNFCVDIGNPFDLGVCDAIWDFERANHEIPTKVA